MHYQDKLTYNVIDLVAMRRWFYCRNNILINPCHYLGWPYDIPQPTPHEKMNTKKQDACTTLHNIYIHDYNLELLNIASIRNHTLYKSSTVYSNIFTLKLC